MMDSIFIHRHPVLPLLLLLFGTVPVAADQPNIVLIFTDDQGWNGTSARMHPERDDSRSDYYQTPNTERLAQAGMRFSRGYSPNSNCSPSRHALLIRIPPESRVLWVPSVHQKLTDADYEEPSIYRFRLDLASFGNSQSIRNTLPT